MSRLILVFAVSYTIFTVGPALLTQPLGVAPRLGDLVDLATPFVLILLYFVIYQAVEGTARWSGPTPLLLMLCGVILVEGHGMHLAANSIGHFLAHQTSSAAYAITYFYDEVLSHTLWKLGVVGFSAILMWRSVRLPDLTGPVELADGAVLGLAALLYGFTFAVSAIEGRTVLLDLPAAVALSGAFAWLWRRHPALASQPVLVFFGFGYAVSLLLMLGWGLHFRGFPEFSQLGYIE